MHTPSRGFTLIELVVTIAVVAILAGVAFPGMGDFIDRQRLVGQTLAIADLAQTARSEAIKRTGSGSRDSKLVTMTITPGPPWSVALDLASKPYTVTATQCAGCTMTAVGSTVTFDFRGIARTAAVNDTKVTLASPKGKKLSVHVSRLGQRFRFARRTGRSRDTLHAPAEVSCSVQCRFQPR